MNKILKLKPLFWDSLVLEDDLQQILNGNVQERFGINKSKIYLRLLESYNWHRILQIIQKNQISEILSDNIIQSIWDKSLKKRYQNARQILY